MKCTIDYHIPLLFIVLPLYYALTIRLLIIGIDFANFTIEKKADATYKVVSAASIIAKVSAFSLPTNY